MNDVLNKTAYYVRDTVADDGVHPGRIYELFPPAWYGAFGDENAVTETIAITCWKTSRGVETHAWPIVNGRIAATHPMEGSINEEVDDTQVLHRMGYTLSKEEL